jgi:ATP-dependent Clp protease ATP-binding subunit ClpA
MRNALQSAQRLAGEFGHHHVGCEHVFLAILLDRNAIPTQILDETGATDTLLTRIRDILGSESYNRPANT